MRLTKILDRPPGSRGILREVPDDEVAAAAGPGWTWDASLYAGSAAFYADGRVAYPPAMVDLLVDALGLDGSGRLLDVGCGPGSLTLLLAPHVAQGIGVDADGGMLAEADRLAHEQGVRNVVWRQLRAEELPADLPPVEVVTFAQSFHWTDRPQVAAAVRRMLAPGGAVVHVHATTHEGVDTDTPLPRPRPPRAAIDRLVRQVLGPERRAGQGLARSGDGGDEEQVYRAAGFRGPRRLELPGRSVERSAAEVRASVYSLSYAAPHLFGDRFTAFDAQLSSLIAAAAPDGRFSELLPPITVDLWR